MEVKENWSPEEIRREFLKLLTTDSETKDRRRRDFNLAIFIPPESEFGGGRAVWSDTDLDMVMDKFDHAIKNIKRAYEGG